MTKPRTNEAAQQAAGAIMTTTTPDTPTIITAPAEYRQIAKHMAFPPDFARHINWESIAQTARELGAHFEARYSQTGECTITMFWSYTEDELNGLSWTGRK
jgi:hypothetical protein